MLERLLALGQGTELGSAPSRSGEMEATVLPDAVLECLGLLSKIAGRAVTFFCAPSAYFPVAIARSEFERIVVTLVTEAAEAAPRGETIAVTLMGMRAMGGPDAAMQLVLTVKDRGRGMRVSRVEPLMEGQMLGGDAEGDARRGPGFAVVRELAGRSGGVVDVESEPGLGTSVSVSWPTLDPGRSTRESRARVVRSVRLDGTDEGTTTLPGDMTVAGTAMLARGVA